MVQGDTKALVPAHRLRPLSKKFGSSGSGLNWNYDVGDYETYDFSGDVHPCQYDWPKCTNCRMNIYEPPIRRFNKNYHLGCFTCAQCNVQLMPNDFYEKNERLFCEKDYHQLFSPKCHSCQGPIKSHVGMRKEVGRVYHAEHFTCAECNKILPSTYKVRDGRLLCEQDFHRLYSPKCQGCQEPICQDPLIAMGKKWHRGLCFRCEKCYKVLYEDTYIPIMGKAYCKFDWLNLFAPKCRGCDGPIAEALNGTSKFAAGNHFHPRCLRCEDCQKLLTEDNYNEYSGQLLCQEHFHLKTCPECKEIQIQAAKNRSKIIHPRSVSVMSRRSMSPMDFIVRAKSSMF